MKRSSVALLLSLLCWTAHAAGRLAEVTIIDRDTGATLPTYRYHGEYWVAGAPGARYAIAVRNRSGERLLAVAAVDGVNVMSGETAAWGQSGYVYAPGQQYEITGWRKSDEEVAAFEFTAAPNSYAARTGRTANIGVIGLALFRECPPLASSQAAPLADQALPMQPSSPPAPFAPAAGLSASVTAERAASAPKLGTGHGQRENSRVHEVDFERLQDSPNEVVRIRYDSVDNLVAMGIIRRAAPLPLAPNAFPDSPATHFVPDPPG